MPNYLQFSKQQMLAIVEFFNLIDFVLVKLYLNWPNILQEFW